MPPPIRSAPMRGPIWVSRIRKPSCSIPSSHSTVKTLAISIAGRLGAGTGSVAGLVTRFVVDCGAVLHLASEEIEVPEEHELLAPTLLRSQTLSALHEAVHRGEIPADLALDRLNRIWAMRI